jgi:H+-translocating NAD(P) transhydrogenase subunit alpha
MVSHISAIAKQAEDLAEQAGIVSVDASSIATKLKEAAVEISSNQIAHADNKFVFAFTIFILACFVGYYVVWKVTPALHTPLMSVTNAISSIIVIGAILAMGPVEFGIAKIIGFIAVLIASINVFGGFAVTHRMLQMFRKK